MKKLYCHYTILSAVIFALLAGGAFAQWPSYPDSNMVICNRTGEQTIAKVVATSDGGCYVSWYDHASTNYDMYMQRLDGNGVVQWAENGMLISNHPQDSWLTDYDLTIDQNDYAILVFNDIRAGGDWDIYGYRISPTGDFAWGADGLTLSDNANTEYTPVVTTTTAGNIVFAWMDDNSVYVRKVDPSGADLWSPATKTITSTYGDSSPRLAAADSDGVIVSYMEGTGPNYYNPHYLYAQKFNADGLETWPSSGVAINTIGGIALYMQHSLTPDGVGGAYEAWYDDRDMTLNAYVQHVHSDGNITWAVNGVQLSTNVSELQMNPALVSFPSSGEVIAFYLATDLDQNQNGVQGQMLDSLGARQWGANGAVFVPLSNQTRSHITAQPQSDGAVVIYKEFPPNDAVNSYIKAIKVDMAGNPVWPTSPVEVCSYLSDKIRVPTTVSPSGMVIAAWEDGRYDPSWDIYLQNVNSDGSLGPQAGPGCNYVVGDVNGSDSYNGLDITYGVAFLKGGPDPMCPDCPLGDCNTWSYCGDVNGSCSYNGLDITYGVAYFKGGPGPANCVDCPPIE